MTEESIKTDVLILGSGIAGIKAAVEAHDNGAKVILVTKGAFARDAAATWMCGAGYQCWGLSPHDTLDVQAEDTLRCGFFLNNQENVYAYLSHIPDTVREMIGWGARYAMENGKLKPLWQLGTSIPEGRCVYPAFYPRGELAYMYLRIFQPPIRNRKGITLLEDFYVTDLLTADDAVVGALGFDIGTGKFKVLQSKTTILASGGYHGLYPVTTGNHNLTGDGQAMAFRAGVEMMNFEFLQTLPCLVWPPALAGDIMPFHLISDKSWSGRLYNSDNERFMEKWDSVNMERTTRAMLSRGISHEIAAGKGSPHGGVYLGVNHLPKEVIEENSKKWARTAAFEMLKESGIDLTKDYVEIGYAQHYCQGGCNVNTKCETDKPGLYAIGEAASGSKDGGDRMSSNSLPFSMAMGLIAGREAADKVKKMEMPRVDEAQIAELKERALAPLKREDGVSLYESRRQLRKTMKENVEYGRNEAGLKAALDEVERYKKEVLPRLMVANKSNKFNLEWVDALGFTNMVLVAESIIRNAAMRTESRGCHGRSDYPEPSAEWFKTIHLRLVDGKLEQWTKPVEFTYWKPEPGSLGEPKKKGVQVKEYKGWRAKPLHEGI